MKVLCSLAGIVLLSVAAFAQDGARATEDQLRQIAAIRRDTAVGRAEFLCESYRVFPHSRCKRDLDKVGRMSDAEIAALLERR